MLAWHCDVALARYGLIIATALPSALVVSHTYWRRLCRSTSRRGTHRQTSASSPFRAPRRAAQAPYRIASHRCGWRSYTRNYVHPMRRRAQHTTLQYGCGHRAAVTLAASFSGTSRATTTARAGSCQTGPIRRRRRSSRSAPRPRSSHPSRVSPRRFAQPSRAVAQAQHSTAVAQHSV
jgi:hypothetical protein